MQPNPPSAVSTPDFDNSMAAQNLLDSMSLPMFSVDRHYRYTAFNAAHAQVMKSIYGVDIQAGFILLDYMTVSIDRETAQKNIDRALAGEYLIDSAYSGEEMLSRLYFEVHHAPIRNTAGEIIGVSVFSFDITELKRTEEALRNSEELFRISFLYANIGVTLVSPNGKYVRVNPAFCEMTGYSEAELLQMSFNHLTLDEDKHLENNIIQEAIAGTRKDAHFEKRYLRKDGTLIWAEVFSTVFRSSTGQFLYLVSHIQDITQTKKVQYDLLEHQTRLDELVQERTNQLIASEMLYRSLFDSISAFIIIFNQETGEIFDANPAACAFLERSYTEVLQSNLPELISMSIQKMRDYVEQIQSGQKIYLEWTHTLKSGEIRNLGFYSEMIWYKQQESILAVVHDITEAKQAEQARRELESRFNILFENLPSVAFVYRIVHDASGQVSNLIIEDANDAALKIHKVAHDELVGKSARVLFSKGFVNTLLKTLNKLTTTGQFHAFEHYANRFQAYLETSVIIISPDRCATISVDLTDRKRIEQDLKDRESTLIDILNAIPNLIWSSRPDGFVDYINQGWLDFTGTTLEQSQGTGWMQALHPDDLSMTQEKWAEAFQKMDSLEMEQRLRRFDGSYHWFLTRAKPMLNARGEVVRWYGANTDITDRTHDQQRILESLAFSQMILDSSPIGITIYNTLGDCISANKAAGQIFGVDQETLLKQNIHTIETWGKSGLHAAAMRALETGRPIATQIHSRTTFGREIWLNATYVSFKSSGETHLLFMFQDDSERQKAEENLRLSNEKLEVMVVSLEESRKYSDLMRQMSDMLQVSTGMQEAFAVIEQFAPQLFPGAGGALFAAHPDAKIMEASNHWGDSLASEMLFPFESCWALRRGEIYMVNASPLALKCQHMDKKFTGCYLNIPLIVSGERIALLHIEWPQVQELDQNIREHAKVFADQTSLSLSNIKLRETLHNQSIHDPLTQMFNRRFMEETLEREMPRARRKNSPLSLLMLDLDYFKKFNDTYGHPAGDLVLARLGGLLHSLVRHEDIVCRWGGEEFLIILPDTNLEVALQRAESVRQAVQNFSIEYNNRILNTLSVSIGVTVYPLHGTTMEQLLLRVDRALYRAKSNGRNRVEKVLETDL